jgi:RND family efflux transporter MFP subunit
MTRAVAAIIVVLSARALVAQTVESFTEPYRKVDLVPAESGVLRSLDVREGEQVAKNQQLGGLDCEVQEIALAIARANLEARGQLESAAAERDLRKSRLAKLQELQTSGHATNDEVERAVADLAVAEANFLAATEKRKIDELEFRRIAALIDRRILKSPIDGVVTRIYKEEAEFVGATSTPLMTIMQLDPLRITFSVPNSHAQALRVGQSVALSLPESKRRAVGQVEFVSPVTDAESGTVRVKVLLKNSDGQYRSGVRCEIDLSTTRTPTQP